jgi:hypothetical protein
LFVEQEMVVAEMRSADMPVKILGLQVERKRIRKNLVELGGQFTHGRIGKIGRGVQGRGRLAARIESSNLVVHGITLDMRINGCNHPNRAVGADSRFNACRANFVP